MTIPNTNLKGNSEGNWVRETKNDFKGVGHSQSGTHRQYLKGSYVLRMLRYVVGHCFDHLSIIFLFLYIPTCSIVFQYCPYIFLCCLYLFL